MGQPARRGSAHGPTPSGTRYDSVSVDDTAGVKPRWLSTSMAFAKHSLQLRQELLRILVGQETTVDLRPGLASRASFAQEFRLTD